MTPSQVRSLLYELCVDLGFCLPPDDQSRLADAPLPDIDAFTDAVFVAEGMKPHAHLKLRTMVRERVAKHFKLAGEAVPERHAGDGG